jgi:hypothetical protein
MSVPIELWNFWGASSQSGSPTIMYSRQNAMGQLETNSSLVRMA